jgi:cytochrome c oxidase subunit 3
MILKNKRAKNELLLSFAQKRGFNLVSDDLMKEEEFEYLRPHPFQVVDPSPWPFLLSFSLLSLTSGLVMWLHNYIGGGNIAFLGLILVTLITALWWRDMIRESTFAGDYTTMVRKNILIGMILFIFSEVMLFVGFFWAFFDASLTPSPFIGAIWPPLGITPISLEIPLLNTLLLLMSGVTITYVHHLIIDINSKFDTNKPSIIQGFLLTLLLALTFTLFQLYEYIHASFTISDSVYGAVFYSTTGLHGFHVLVGSIFIAFCFFRYLLGHYTSNRHTSFICAIWYWHFVDVVWLFLVIFVYIWGSDASPSFLKEIISSEEHMKVIYNEILYSSPLEQFELDTLHLFGKRKAACFTIITVSALSSLFFFIAAYLFLNWKVIPNNYWQALAEDFFDFIFSISKSNEKIIYNSNYINNQLAYSTSKGINYVRPLINKTRYKMFPLTFATFCLLLNMNFSGMLPYSFTITAQIIATATLSSILFFGINIQEIQIQKFNFFNRFSPGKISLILVPYLLPIETLSYFFRCISLPVRLFANLMSGHTLIKILLGFFWLSITGGFKGITCFYPKNMVFFFILFVFTLLELAMAFLQAYVFCVLLSVYRKDASIHFNA